MKILDLIKESESVWTEKMTTQELLIKLNVSAFKYYVDHFNKELYTLRGMYENPLATKEHLDKLIRENNEELRKRGLVKPLNILVREESCDGSDQLSLF